MIRPVELQGVVQRSQDISSMRQGENIRPAVEQANINIQQNKNYQQRSEQVNTKDNAELTEKRYDAKEKGSNEYENPNGNNSKRKRQELDTDSDGRVIIKTASRFDASV